MADTRNYRQLRACLEASANARLWESLKFPCSEAAGRIGPLGVDMRPLPVTPVFRAEWPVSGGVFGKNRPTAEVQHIKMASPKLPFNSEAHSLPKYLLG
jgi:hypothetical protein